MIEYVSRLPPDEQQMAYNAMELLAESGLLLVLAEAVVEEVAKSMVTEEPDDQSLRRLRIAHGVGVILTRLHADATKLKDERLASVTQQRPDYEPVL